MKEFYGCLLGYTRGHDGSPFFDCLKGVYFCLLLEFFKRIFINYFVLLN